jgi:glycosyltransferase involved in cell wall biosynthesis
MRIVMADAGLPFDGLTPRERPLGGAESAFVALAEALAARGAEVVAYARDARPLEHERVVWRPFFGPDLAAERGDLLIANRDPKLIAAATIRRKAFWLHNPAGFLAKPRYLVALLAHRPALVFAGPAHARTAPRWLPLHRVQIPLGVEAPFLRTERTPGIPEPRALFVSNATRGLAPLLALWRERILPRAPGARLIVHSGPGVYAAAGAKAEAMTAVLTEAAQTPGVAVAAPLPKADLARAWAAARLLIYLGDPGETFCLAVAEAQAMGVPCVVKPVGAVGERVVDGETGFVATDDGAFAAAAVRLMTEDVLWRRQSAAALARRPTMGWDRAAAAFAALASPAA